MMEAIDVRVQLSGQPTYEGGQWLQRLRLDLQRELEVPCKVDTVVTPENSMDGGITVAIAIAGLSLNLITTLLAVLKYHKDLKQRTKVTITTKTVQGDEIVVESANLNDEEAERLVEAAKLKAARELIVTVST